MKETGILKEHVDQDIREYYCFSENVERIDEKLHITFDSISMIEFNKFRIESYNDISSIIELIDSIRSYQISLTLNADSLHQISDRKKIEEGRWYKLTASLGEESTSLQASLTEHSSENSESNSISIRNISFLNKNNSEAKKLSTVFSLSHFATPPREGFTIIEEITNHIVHLDDGELRFPRHFRPFRSFRSLVAHDVGQGSCNSLRDRNITQVYFDVGGGAGRNTDTYPRGTEYIFDNHHEDAVVILSHWDKDHWVSAERHPHLCDLTWIVPDQALGVSHTRLARRIGLNGKLFVWTSHRQTQAIETQYLSLYKLPTHRNRNYSGIVAIYKPHGRRDNSVLIPGDSPYGKVDALANHEVIATIVPHHGGTFYGDNPPNAPQSHKVVYSYGRANREGHPTFTTTDKHHRFGWLNRRDTIYGCVLVHPINLCRRNLLIYLLHYRHRIQI